ncbi:hypothetical protein XBKB1_3060002 [Xenorhabdus bovienii str. kraussei Becker Underwood]|uniref:Uncharacterized protein n=1 Tax=Xenorhabdus bovienii str. kraussei Becker Underwood TaxID=1398204 RepID=A0A077PK60_XENBV|nr:hypothetical protein XBKB1_3060002 [Xenorhabdus bovienii str. kraussei Becker Underwood]
MSFIIYNMWPVLYYNDQINRDINFLLLRNLFFNSINKFIKVEIYKIDHPVRYCFIFLFRRIYLCLILSD